MASKHRRANDEERPLAPRSAARRPSESSASAETRRDARAARPLFGLERGGLSRAPRRRHEIVGELVFGVGIFFGDAPRAAGASRSNAFSSGWPRLARPK